MSLEEEQVSTAETSPEPSTKIGSSQKKPKRLTLQERLAAAAKTKRKKAETSETSELSTTSLPQSTSEIADNRADSGSEDSKSVSVKENPPNSEGGEIAEEASSAPTESTETTESVAETPAEPVISDVNSISEVVTKEEASIEKVDVPADKETNGKQASEDVGEVPRKTRSDAAEIEEFTKIDENSVVSTEIGLLKREIDALKSQLEQQKKETTATARRAPATAPAADKRAIAEKDKIIAQLEKKVSDRDSTVHQLMEEGQELSKKELKLNERIRSLASNNTKLEASLRDYAEKNEESLLKLGEIEDLVKSHKLKSVDQLFDVLSSANQKAAELQNSLTTLKESNWEGKYKEMQRLYERELDEKRELNRELGEVRVQLELLQNQSKLELQSKSDIISQLNREIMSSKDESSTEVLRLEAKIESLRMENENFLKGSHGLESEQRENDNENENGNENENQSENGHVLTKKHVDYADFVKLSDTHQNLQAQYVSSQENWKLIESNLSNKVDALSASVETLKKAKAKNTAELKKMHAQLNMQADEIEQLTSDLSRARQETAEQEFQTQMKQSEVQEMEDKLEELKTVFASDRKNYDIKIKNLTETIQNYETVSQAQTPTCTPAMSYDNLAAMQSGIQSRRGFRDSGLHIHMDSRAPISRKFSSHSVASSALNTPAQGWDDASFVSGGAETPLYENHNTSSLSFNDEIYPFDAPEGEGDTSVHPGMHSAGSGATKHIQIINKMSSSIRRLEAEIHTLKDENVHLSAQKESAQRELVSRFDLDKKVGQLEERIVGLQQEMEEKAKKESTLLEVIGEKSERVGELEADVVDLKDLLRSQVQQMIEMQNK